MEEARRFLMLKSRPAGLFSGLQDDVNREGALEFLKEKLAELLHFFQHIWACLVDKVDEVFPPETRADALARWARVGLTVAVPLAILILCLCCCCRGGRCCRGGGRGRMMRAPGRGGARMPRAAFEGNPLQYFRDLRADKPLLY